MPMGTAAFPLTSQTLYFSTFPITRQIFYLTPLSLALVNLKPLLPGHVLICPRRVERRYTGLTSAELTDLSLTTQRVARTLERVYRASALNIAVQDGPDAGQSVPHVHVHVIPRQKDDLKEQGGTDAVYDLLESDEANLDKQLSEVKTLRNGRPKPGETAKPDVEKERKPRTLEEMEEEAKMLANEMSKDWGSPIADRL